MCFLHLRGEFRREDLFECADDLLSCLSCVDQEDVDELVLGERLFGDPHAQSLDIRIRDREPYFMHSRFLAGEDAPVGFLGTLRKGIRHESEENSEADERSQKIHGSGNVQHGTLPFQGTGKTARSAVLLFFYNTLWTLSKHSAAASLTSGHDSYIHMPNAHATGLTFYILFFS